MAEGAASVVPSTELLEWPKKDKRRFLHAVYRVGDLDRTIQFYTECFGMKLLRKRDIPEEKYANAFLGFGPEESQFVVELTCNYGVDKYDIGTGFGHFAIATQDVYKLVEDIKAKGGTITREPGPVKGGSTAIAFAKDPDGYLFELIQRGPTPEPLCQVMLRVGDLDRSIKFYEKALGMRPLKKTDRPEQKYTIAMMGYADEYETIALELTYNYGVTEYTKGNAYAQIAISTDDVYKSAEVVNAVIKELGGKITRQPGPIPGINTKITSFLDPDGWETVLVDNEDFLKELEAIVTEGSCFHSEFPMELLYSSSCKHLTMCFACGKKFAKERSQCYKCGTPITRLIQEYNVRLASPNDKSYSIAKFPLGLPNFEPSNWSLEKEGSETLKLKDESGLLVYTGGIADPGSQYYILIPQSNDEIVAIPACSWYNFQKVPRGQLSEEDFEKKNVEIKRTSAPLRFMIDAAAAPFCEAAAPFGEADDDDDCDLDEVDDFQIFSDDESLEINPKHEEDGKVAGEDEEDGELASAVLLSDGWGSGQVGSTDPAVEP